MTTTTREAFERGTETFNAHDIEGFADVLADDVVWHIIDELAVEEGTFTGTHDGTHYAPTGDCETRRVGLSGAVASLVSPCCL